jgi:hypothetical protein
MRNYNHVGWKSGAQVYHFDEADGPGAIPNALFVPSSYPFGKGFFLGRAGPGDIERPLAQGNQCFNYC